MSEQKYVIVVTRPQLAVILAGLNVYLNQQLYDPKKRDLFLEEIATDDDSVQPINTAEEITDLCEDVNFSLKLEEFVEELKDELKKEGTDRISKKVKKRR